MAALSPAESPHRPNSGQPVTTSTGRSLHLDARLPGGRSHTTYLAHEPHDNHTLVVKTGGDPRKLDHEALVLTQLAAIPGAPAPRLIEASLIHLPGSAPQPCLILRHIRARHPCTPADQRAFGAALATLHNLPAEPFHAFHRDTAELLQPARTFVNSRAPQLVTVLDALTPPPGHRWPIQVLIHGDAAPANTLISDRDGHATLIDYENAALAHPGLDLGRVLFLINLNDTTSDHQHSADTDALLTGYARHRPLPPQLGHWAAAAGLTITAWRYARRTQPHIPPWPSTLHHAERWALGERLRPLNGPARTRAPRPPALQDSHPNERR